MTKRNNYMVPMVAGVAVVGAAAATYMLVGEKNRKKVMTSMSDMKEGFVARFKDSSEKPSMMMKGQKSSKQSSKK